MTTHYEDEAQIDSLKRWWKENWIALVAGLGVGLGAIFGWEQWKSHEAGQSEQASQIYEDLKQAVGAGKTEEANASADRLIKDFASSPYAADAALVMAAKAVQEQQLDQALARLQWVAANTKDEGIKRVATLRQARVLWAQGKSDEALKLLDGEAGEYAPLYEELRGDIRLAKGDRPGARQAYEKALQAAPETGGNRELLQLKLDDLADVVQS